MAGGAHAGPGRRRPADHRHAAAQHGRRLPRPPRRGERGPPRRFGWGYRRARVRQEQRPRRPRRARRRRDRRRPAAPAGGSRPARRCCRRSSRALGDGVSTPTAASTGRARRPSSSPTRAQASPRGHRPSRGDRREEAEAEQLARAGATVVGSTPRSWSRPDGPPASTAWWWSTARRPSDCAGAVARGMSRGRRPAADRGAAAPSRPSWRWPTTPSTRVGRSPRPAPRPRDCGYCSARTRRRHAAGQPLPASPGLGVRGVIATAQPAAAGERATEQGPWMRIAFSPDLWLLRFRRRATLARYLRSGVGGAGGVCGLSESPGAMSESLKARMPPPRPAPASLSRLARTAGAG